MSDRRVISIMGNADMQTVVLMFIRFILGVGMRRTGDIEGVRQSSGNWQRGDNISWTKRLICEPLDKYKVHEIAKRM